MNTDIKHIAALVATTIWADGEYDAAEKIVVEEIADAFELNAEEFAAAVEAPFGSRCRRNDRWSSHTIPGVDLKFSNESISLRNCVARPS